MVPGCTGYSDRLQVESIFWGESGGAYCNIITGTSVPLFGRFVSHTIIILSVRLYYHIILPVVFT